MMTSFKHLTPEIRHSIARAVSDHFMENLQRTLPPRKIHQILRKRDVDVTLKGTTDFEIQQNHKLEAAVKDISANWK